MYIDRILKSRNPQNSNLVRKNRENNYFSSRTKLEVIRYKVAEMTNDKIISLLCLKLPNLLVVTDGTEFVNI